MTHSGEAPKRSTRRPLSRPPNTNPNSLAEKVAAAGSRCPIPFTHDRLFEMHHWWHEMAGWYHEPEPLRYRIGAYIQAARSVTFMLQKERAAFKDFDWYDTWVEKAKADPILRWLNDTRVDFVHRKSLEPFSTLEMRCIENPRQIFDDDDGHPLVVQADPFRCTHYYLQGPNTDHSHEFERHWSLDGLEGRELLDACADVYDRLDRLVEEAHDRAGATLGSHRREGSHRALPCMEDTAAYRIVRTVLKNGREVWEDEPVDAHRN